MKNVLFISMMVLTAISFSSCGDKKSEEVAPAVEVMDKAQPTAVEVEAAAEVVVDEMSNEEAEAARTAEAEVVAAAETEGGKVSMAGGNCCLPAGSQGSYTLCSPGGAKCCSPIAGAQCTGAGGVVKATAAICAAAPAAC